MNPTPAGGAGRRAGWSGRLETTKLTAAQSERRYRSDSAVCGINMGCFPKPRWLGSSTRFLLARAVASLIPRVTYWITEHYRF